EATRDRLQDGVCKLDRAREGQLAPTPAIPRYPFVNGGSALGCGRLVQALPATACLAIFTSNSRKRSNVGDFRKRWTSPNGRVGDFSERFSNNPNQNKGRRTRVSKAIAPRSQV